jgi:hypothetical protein
MRICFASTYSIFARFGFRRAGGCGRNARRFLFWRDTQIQNQNCAFVHHIIVSSLKKIHPRHPPREFPLGLRAPILGMGTAQIPGNEPFPFLVGERILLSPVRCLGSCSFQSHPAEAGQGSPHPAAQTPLRFFMFVFSVSLSLPISHYISHRRSSLAQTP